MDDLCALINALSASEKQHFKKKYNPDSDFILLFDYLNRKKSIVNSEAIVYLSKKHKQKKKFTSSYLAVVKSYLKNKILESLRIQFIHKRKNYELLGTAMNADILLEKGLYNLAKAEIDSSINKNLDGSFPIERLLLLRRKSILYYFENYSNTNLDNINALFESRLESAEQLILEIKFSKILSIMSYQYFNGLNDPELLKSFMEEPYMKDESLSTHFATKYLFHWVHAQLEEFQNDNEKALIHFNKSIEVWLDNPKYIEAHPRMYLGACFSFFKYLVHQNEPFSTIVRDINFDTLLSHIKTEHLSPEEEEKHESIFKLFKVLSLREQNRMSEIIEIVNHLYDDQATFPSMGEYEEIILRYYSALAYFEKGNYTKAENILFNYISHLDERLASNPIYITVYILLHLLILLETGKVRQLRNLIPKYRKYLRQEEKLTLFEKLFLDMISQLISARFQATPELVYKRFLKRLLTAQITDDRGIQLEYDYLVDWVRKKEIEQYK